MWKNRIKSFKYAFQGIFELVRSQPNARIHLVAAILVFIAGAYFNITDMEWIAVIFAITIVLAAEGFNTALEYLTDLVSPEYHPLAGKAKDVAAAAVLICALGAATVGVMVFLPYLLGLL